MKPGSSRELHERAERWADGEWLDLDSRRQPKEPGRYELYCHGAPRFFVTWMGAACMVETNVSYIPDWAWEAFCEMAARHGVTKIWSEPTPAVVAM